MKTIRQAIPNEEIEANMKNEPRSTRSTRYSRVPSYIMEDVAEARVALVALTFGGIAVIAIAAAIASTVYAMDRIQAQSAPIFAKSEMSKQEIKALNISKAPAEKRK